MFPFKSSEYQFAYVPIPKVACSSLKVAIATALKIEGSYEHAHNIKFDLIDLDGLSNLPDRYYRFAFIRNPWDKIVSCYKDKILHCTDHLGNKDAFNGKLPPFMRKFPGLSKGMDFKDFLKVISGIDDYHAEEHFKSQWQFLYDRNNRLAVDDVYRFEKIEESWLKICEKLGLNYVALEHRKKVEGMPYQEYFDDESIEIVRKRYEIDINAFKFSFNG